MCLSGIFLIRLTEVGRPILIVGRDPGLNKKGESKWSTSTHLSLLSDWGCHVTRHLKLLLPCFPWHEDRTLELRVKTNPSSFKLLFVRMF